MIIILYILATLTFGFIIGRISYALKERRQCFYCGSFNTYKISEVRGGIRDSKGNEVKNRYSYAVKTNECHLCKVCESMMQVKITLYTD